MSAYRCTKCSNKDDGAFLWAQPWGEATRCPRCGVLVDSSDVEEL